jgi:RNA polymerase sigma-70 factor (ECF subfamily)
MTPAETEALQAILAEGRAAWPDIELDEARFVAHLEGADLGEARTHAAELYLACACAAGDPRALARFDERYLAAIAGHLRRFGDLAPDVLQELRTRLYLTVDGQPPRLRSYAGVGTLLGWLKMTAVRLAIDLQRARGRGGEEVAGDVPDPVDPELAFIKNRYRGDFQAAVRAALARLDVKERSVLRLYLVDRLNIGEIGAILHVHRATVARWIATFRERVREETGRQLHERLGGSASEIESLIRLLDSELEVSLHLEE